MTAKEAAALVKAKWSDNDGCRSCGWKSAIYEYGDIEDLIDDEDLANGYVDLPCFSSDGYNHRGVRARFK